MSAQQQQRGGSQQQRQQQGRASGGQQPRQQQSSHPHQHPQGAPPGSAFERRFNARNDETFGDDAMEAANDFNFGHAAPVPAQAMTTPGQPAPSLVGNIWTLDQLEAGFQHASVSMTSNNVQAAAPPVARVMTAADLEASMMARPAVAAVAEQPQHAPAPASNASAAAPVEKEQIQQAHVHEHEQKQQPSEYDGLMTDYEKELIARIQLSQLANDETYEDDFYCRRFMDKLRKQKQQATAAAQKAVAEATTGDRTADSGSSANMMDVFKQASDAAEAAGGAEASDGKPSLSDGERFQKLLAEAKANARPRATQISVQGALGHIPINTLRNPKQIVQVQALSTSSLNAGDAPKQITPRTVQKAILRTVESVYVHVMGIDQLYRQWEQARERDVQVSPDQQTQWNQEYTLLVKELWTDFLVRPEDRDADKVTASSLSATLSTTPSDLTLARFLSFSKGRRVIGRVVRFLPRDQVLILLKAVFISLKNIALTSTDPVAVLAELDEYANWVVYPFVPIIAEAGVEFVLECLQGVISSGEVVQIARTKPGLLFLTLFTSRAEIIRQKATTPTAALTTWLETTYPAFFACFQTRFAALFPPAHILPPIVTSSLTAIPQPIPVDDLYAWQFLAAVAVGASPDQQRTLVTEARDKIFETVSTQGAKGRDKANIFLNALGLDASQLSM